MEELLTDLKNTSLLEYLGVLTGITYVILAAFKKRICWLFALISTGIYTWLCFIGQLYIESSLQVFYFVMAIYGWIKWSNDLEKNLPIIRWPLLYHFYNIVISAFMATILGYFVSVYTDQSQPYLDAFTTVFSLAATFMIAKRVLENWIYWILIDLALFVLYASKGYVLTGIQYGLFSLIALFALFSWYKFYKVQKV